MANSGKQSPLGVNVLGSYLTDTGLTINPVTAAQIGSSKTNDQYSFGTIINETSLRLLTWAINDGWNRGPANSNTTLTDDTYDNLISIGTGTLPALGNSKPPSYAMHDPAGVWQSAGYPATTGYSISGDTDQGQAASWLPYDTTNPNSSVTQWGYLRLYALQGWNEFNWNGTTVTQDTPEYKEFCSSFMTAGSWINSTNQAVVTVSNSQTFMDGTYSNMDDMVSADVAGVSLSSKDFGDDLINLGNIINLRRIDAFGLPSVLLATLGASYAINQDLTLALLSTGLTTGEIAQLTSGTIPFVTPEQELKIYNAYLLIMGENLANILAPLQCNTQGFSTLADLLDVRKLFPNSYGTITVPMYNGTLGLPTNSKTYYLLYDNGGVNSALTTPEMNDYVGIQIPSGAPPVYDASRSPDNYRELATGFGSYLNGILPNNLAIPAGAFSFTMRQIRNIAQVDFKKFSKAVKGMESMQGLDQVSGTSLPTNQDLLDAANTKLALGSGPRGGYTYSDMFGCMSGLPYPWKLIKKRINDVETTKLYNIYQQLFLAVTWEAATVDVEYTSYMVGPTTYYTVTGVTVTNPGGGYSRGTSPDPVVTLSNGGTGVGVVGRNEQDAGSNGAGTFGRVQYINLTSVGADTTSVPTVTIETPPTNTLPVSITGDIAAGGANQPSGTLAWQQPLNQVVQAYIDQANAEISQIQLNNADAAVHLSMYWTNMGSQLMIEQRSRTMAITPVPIPKDNFQNPYPMMIQTFVDSMPSFSLGTAPHMSAQTIEMITNLDTTGGQSAVGMMRQERNQARLQDAGIELDNDIPDQLSPTELRQLTTNGTLPSAGPGAGIPSCDPGTEYTLPAWPINIKDGKEVVPVPSGAYTSNPAYLTGEFTSYGQVAGGDITPIIQCFPNPIVAPLVPVGPANTTPSNGIVIIQAPAELDPSNVLPNLDPNYTSSTLMPSSPTVPQAIDQVISCNCDCWVR